MSEIIQFESWKLVADQNKSCVRSDEWCVRRAGWGGFAAGTAKGRAPLRRAFLRQGKNINVGFCAAGFVFMVFSRQPKNIMGWGELFAARLLEDFVRQPAAPSRDAGPP
jgi:hypothetical protein